MQTVYDFNVKLPDGEEKAMKDYEGELLLIVNTASKCGFTPQFKGLQDLYEKYKDEGLVILGFPSDQFKNQEFSNIEDTIQFCQMNYGINFPMFAKVDVNGDEEDPLFTFLKKEQKGMLTENIKWNFTKFLVDRQGQVIDRYAPTTTPEKMEEDIKAAL